MNALLAYPTTAIRTQTVTTLMDHSTVLAEMVTVEMASAVVVCLWLFANVFWKQFGVTCHFVHEFNAVIATLF